MQVIIVSYIQKTIKFIYQLYPQVYMYMYTSRLYTLLPYVNNNGCILINIINNVLHIHEVNHDPLMIANQTGVHLLIFIEQQTN